MKDFDAFPKIAKNVGDLGKIKSAITRPIWSHWSHCLMRERERERERESERERL